MSDRQHRRRHRRGPAPTGGAVAVIGLGRFGSQVAESLIHIGHEVLAIDDDPEVVQKWSDQLTYVAQADSTDENALRQLGLADFEWVVVALGSALQASVLTVLALTELKVRKIWGRAASDQHAKILSAVGAHHVIFPEAAMGERVAHLIVSQLLDFIELDGDYAIASTRMPAALAGRRLDEIGLAQRRGVVVIGVKDPTGRFEGARPDLVIPAGGILIVEGTIDQVQEFAAGT